MKIYFAASSAGIRGDTTMYAQMVVFLKNSVEVLSQHMGDNNSSGYSEHQPTVKEIYESTAAMIRKADAVIAEVTTLSADVGYEIGLAEALGKPILCLYQPDEDKNLPAMIVGNPHITVRTYWDVVEANKAMAGFIQKL